MRVKQAVKPVLNRLGLTENAREVYITCLRMLEGRKTTVRSNGCSADFHLQTNMEYRMLCRAQSEQQVMDTLLEELNSESVFFDVGANVGRYTCLADNLGADVFAFEPHPDNATRLSENILLNEGTATVFEIALSDEDTDGHLSLARDNELGEGGHQIVHSGTTTVSVDFWRGDTITETKDLENPTAIKIDVEGAECRVLEGFENTIAESKPALYIEVHPHHMDDFGDSVDTLYEILERYEYDSTVIYDRGKGHFIKATPR